MLTGPGNEGLIRLLSALSSTLRLLLFYAYSLLMLPLIMAVVVARPGSDSYYRVARVWIAGILAIFGSKLEVEGLAQLDADQDYVFLSNHRSLLDPPAIGVAVAPKVTRWVAKQELRRVPVFGKALELTGQIFIDRRNTANAVDALERHTGDRGAIIVFFPEGHRARGRSLLPFKKGGAAFAIRAGLPVVPVAISGSEYCLPSRSLQSRPGRIRVRIGAPIPTTGLHFDQRGELMALVETRVRTMIEEMEGPADRADDDGNPHV